MTVRLGVLVLVVTFMLLIHRAFAESERDRAPLWLLVCAAVAGGWMVAGGPI